MKLPLFVTRKNKYVAGSLMYGIGYSFYYLTNHYPFAEPHPLPMSWVDLHTPFLPYSIYVYISEYFYFAAVYIRLDSYNNINKYLYSFFLLQVSSCIFFMIYPTVYPRGHYPVPTDLPGWLQGTWTWLRTVDTPGNCFPSLHVSSVYLSAFVFWTDKHDKKRFWFFIIWATLITLSTLTTKQHYLLDIISAMILSVAFFWYFHFKQEYQRVYGDDEGNSEVVLKTV